MWCQGLALLDKLDYNVSGVDAFQVPLLKTEGRANVGGLVALLLCLFNTIEDQ